MIAAAISLVLAGQFGGSALDNALVDGDKVHLFLPPVVVSEGRHLSSAWSSDGSYLIVASEHVAATPKDFANALQGKPRDVKSAVELSLYNYRTGIAKRIYSSDVGVGSFAHVLFFPDTDTAIANIHSPSSTESELVRIYCGTSKSELLERTSKLNYIGVSPSGQLVAITDRETSVRFVSRDGKLYPRQETPAPGVLGWASDNSPILLTQLKGVYDVDPNGGIRRSDRRPGARQMPEAEPSRVQSHETTVAVEGAVARVQVVLAHIAETNRYINVGYQAQYPEVSPKSNGIFFSANGINYVRPIIQIDKSVFDEMLASAERTAIMSKVQQIGLALAMYAADNGDAYPDAGNLESSLGLYLRDSSILSGFAYTGPSGNLGPAETQVGFMPCPGGRAVLYQDGHVVFVPDR